MTKDTAGLASLLQDLNDLLVRERQAIIHLRMRQLTEIQGEKTAALKRLQQVEQVVDPAAQGLIRAIKSNNERNRLLLESGLKVVRRLQDNIFRRLALTYAAHGRSLTLAAGPRLLNRSV